MLASSWRNGLHRNLISLARSKGKNKNSDNGPSSSNSVTSCIISSNRNLVPTRSISSFPSFPSSSSCYHTRSFNQNGLRKGALGLTSMAMAHPILNHPSPSSRRNLSFWGTSSSKPAVNVDATFDSLPQPQSESESAAAMSLPPSTPGQSSSIESDLSSSASSSSSPSSTSTSTTTTLPSESPIDSFSLPTTDQVSEAMSSSTSETMTELASYGLGHASDSYFNIRYAEVALDWLVNTTGLPWWAVIAGLTISIRLAVAPILVWSQANSIRMNNIQPKMQEGMKDLQRAKATGNQAEMAESAAKVRKLMKDNDVSVMRGFAVPLIQMPIFITFFFALRAIANAGLPSLKEGGFGWVSDLSLADPYYILPCLSAALTLGVIETGAETGGTATNMGPQQKMMKNVLRVLTVGVIPFIASFPAAVFVFWSMNNAFSLLQLLALRTEWLKTKLKLPKKIDHKKSASANKEQSFLESIRSQMYPEQSSSSSSSPSSPAVVATGTGTGRRMVDPSREGAMRELFKEKSKPSPPPSPSPEVKSSSQKAMTHQHGQGKKSKKSNPNQSSTSDLEKQTRGKAREEKRRRVQAAREKR